MRWQTFTPALVRPSRARRAISTGIPLRMKRIASQTLRADAHVLVRVVEETHLLALLVDPDLVLERARLEVGERAGAAAVLHHRGILRTGARGVVAAGDQRDRHERGQHCERGKNERDGRAHALSIPEFPTPQ